VEPRVGQLKPKRILPVDPGTHGIGGLAVAQLLEELEHRDQRQPPRRQTRLAAGGVEGGEVRIAVKRVERVAQPHDNGALGKCRLGNPRGLGRNRADRLRVKAHG
jgi:hypothetical protein